MDRWYVDPGPELEQSLMRSAHLFETMRVEGGEIRRLDLHLERMEASAKTLGICYAKGMEQWLEKTARLPSSGTFRLKILLGEEGRLSAVLRPYEDSLQPLELVTRLWSPPADAGHKRAERGAYREAREAARSSGASDALLIDGEDRLLETSIANLLFLIKGELLTPPVDLGILPGTVRRLLIERGRVREELLTLSDLEKVEAVFATNSLIRVSPVARIDQQWYRTDHPELDQIARDLIEMRF